MGFLCKYFFKLIYTCSFHFRQSCIFLVENILLEIFQPDTSSNFFPPTGTLDPQGTQDPLSHLSFEAYRVRPKIPTVFCLLVSEKVFVTFCFSLNDTFQIYLIFEMRIL